MDSSPTAKTLLRHATFYLPYGDLIVQSAPDESGAAIIFRVNRSVLAFNSPVFADMFTLPNTSAQELYDDAPVVCVPDTAEELNALFLALHDPR